MPTPPLAQARFRRTLTWAVAAPPLAALALAGVFLWQVMRLLAQERWVTHTDEVIALANQTEKLLLRTQGAVRGYLLTGGARFLDRHRQADAEAPRSADALVQLVADNPPQVERAKAIALLIERSRISNAKLVGVRENGGEYRNLMGSAEHQSLLDERDRLFSQFIQIEEGLREQRSGRATYTARTVIAVSLCLATLLGVVMAAVARRTLIGLSSTYRSALESVERARDQLERRVQERTAQLQDVVGQLEAFNYTVSHDLRAPLRAMQGFSQALVEDHAEQLEPRATQYVRRIAAAAERMDGMIQDLLDYSSLSRSELPLGPVDLGAVVNKAVEQVPHREHAAVGAQGPFPPLLAHAPTLMRVIVNLLTNALKFVRPGERPDVRVYSTETEGRVRLWVEDHGIGIEPEHHDRIFDVFERLHGTEEFPGTGIGLAVVRRACERMGGSCGVESEPGKGSRFWVEFPKADGAAAAAAGTKGG